jgi:transcriptional regulator with XRE-family HTH domain
MVNYNNPKRRMSQQSEYLLDEFRKWEHTMGRRQSVSDFARYLDVSNESLSRWMRGDSIPNYANTVKMSKKLGDEIFAVMGYEPPSVEMEKLRAKFAAAKTPEEKLRIVEDFLQRNGLIQ